MLTQLHIENIAVIQKASVTFTEGLNVFTGETGAGKTILISAIDAVLGERTSRDIIRSGEERALVTALFENISPRAVQMLETLGYQDDEGAVLISREIQQNGKGSCRVNGMPATVSILKEIASLLIHIHGQRDSLQLLAHEQHLILIDAFGGLEGKREGYQKAFGAMCETKEALESQQMDEAAKAQRTDMLLFQIGEIEAANLQDPEEEAQLLTQLRLIKNSEQVLSALSSAYAALQGDGEEGGICALMDRLSEGAGEASLYIEALQPMAAKVEEMGYELSEYARDIRAILDDFEFDPRELDAIESRLDVIHKLKKKYGGSIQEILVFCEGAREELEAISTSEQRIEKLAQQLQEQTQLCQKLGADLSSKRKQAAKQFVKQVEAELAFLDMPNTKLSVQQQTKPLGPTGIDEMELYIVTNLGEEPKPLSKIASGGEVSRIMLAVKNVLAERDDLATLIFDEVDTGVSGRAAQKIGQKLAQVARTRQVICVTHLAQVAAFADLHLLISKQVEKGRTYTRIEALDESASVSELARITSGDLITDTALQNARELHEHSRRSLEL